MIRRLCITASTALLIAAAANAACVNKYVNRPENNRNVVTLLTGKLTFQEAQELASAINARQAPPLEWVDASGKTIAKQFGELRVVRPMPVGCDGKSSGVVMIATFPAVVRPTEKMNVKFDAATTVTFDLQSR